MDKKRKLAVTMVAAIDNQNGIGKGGGIPWVCKDDMQHFKTLTKGGIVLMGSNTFNSLPNGPLPDRENLVITSDRSYGMTIHQGYGVTWDNHISDELFDAIEDHGNKEVFIIGGGEIYKQCMPYATKLILTRINDIHRCDTFFPDWSHVNWALESVKWLNPITRVETYVRKNTK